MNELKTLKNIQENIREYVSEDDGKEVEIYVGITKETLRAEAIKWIKELKENTWIKENAMFADDETGTNHTIAWIQHFFNITDSELSK